MNSNNNYQYTDKQLHFSERTFDIIPKTSLPRNIGLERGMFNQVSDLEFKNPQKYQNIKQTMGSKTTNTYRNPYAICQTDFCDNEKSRKVDKRNRTDIYDKRLSNTSKYVNNTNKYIDRFSQLDQSNPNADKYKHVKTQNMNFQEFLEFKKKMNIQEGTPKY